MSDKQTGPAPGDGRRAAAGPAGRPRCSHLDQVRDVAPAGEGCAECLALGDSWVHLRVCLACGHVGCCDQSKNKHATQHFHATGHPLIRSLEPWEDWVWCYEDQVYVFA